MSFILSLIIIAGFYVLLQLIDTVVFHNRPGEFRDIIKSKVFVMLSVLSTALALAYFMFRGQDLLSTVLFLMYSVFLSKLVVKRM